MSGIVKYMRTLNISDSFISEIINTIDKLWRKDDYTQALTLCRELSICDKYNFIVLEQYVEVIQHVLANGIDDVLTHISEDGSRKSFITFHADLAMKMFIGLLDDSTSIHINDISTETLIILLAIDAQINDFIIDLSFTNKLNANYMSLSLETRLMLLETINERVEELTDEVNNAF